MASPYAHWKPFPHDAAAFDHKGASLAKHWPRLHRGDREPFPDEAHLGALVAAHEGLAPKTPLKVAIRALQEAWRAFHRGDYGAAAGQGLAIGPLGYTVANKAAILYATYLEDDHDARRDLLLQAAHRAEEAQALAPDMPNAWYLHAQALGRYGQHISIAKALADGLSGRIKDSLERTLALEPGHADANIALGLYHALIVHKMGSLVARLTYGVSAEAAQEHFAAALRLNPDSAIARIEYANGLAMLHGKARMSEAVRLYGEAAACEPADATEWLDVELAKAELRE